MNDDDETPAEQAARQAAEFRVFIGCLDHLEPYDYVTVTIPGYPAPALLSVALLRSAAAP